MTDYTDPLKMDQIIEDIRSEAREYRNEKMSETADMMDNWANRLEAITPTQEVAWVDNKGQIWGNGYALKPGDKLFTAAAPQQAQAEAEQIIESLGQHHAAVKFLENAGYVWCGDLAKWVKAEQPNVEAVQQEAKPDLIAQYQAALRSVNAVAIERGDKYGACDQIDNDGQPYQSQWFADLLAMAPQAEAQSKGEKQ